MVTLADAGTLREDELDENDEIEDDESLRLTSESENSDNDGTPAQIPEQKIRSILKKQSTFMPKVEDIHSDILSKNDQ